MRWLDNTRFVTNGINAMLAVIGRGRAMAEIGGSIRPQHDAHRHGGVHGEAARPSSSTERTAESSDVLDLAGMNYMDARYEIDREQFPRRVIVGSETFPEKIDELWRLVAGSRT